ncbi:AI-2E family transporter [Ferruginibacter albus]|uniref:AI-2E family transporter n=1 Tax=Ferruginibacter albus TaxID=2875540 RepID=UPI001CC4EB7D|nr:AI-2E family transporter [Ferruginibacter albus]UAY53330.1 AI-2E family transporter [Ferruginibacter albus]
MNTIKKYPFYFQATTVLFGLILFVYALMNLKNVVIPLLFASLLSVLLNPIVDWLEKKRVPKVISILLSIFLALIVLLSVMYFISSQLMSFRTELPVLRERFAALFVKLRGWLNLHMNVSYAKQEELIQNGKHSLESLLGQTLGIALGVINVFVLIPVYTFLFIYYKKLILNFLFEVFATTNSKEVGIVLSQTKGAVQNYMIGLMVEGLIIATLNTVALLILGVKYSLLLGLLGAILNVLPLFGGFIAILLPVIIATITKDGFTTQIWIIVSYTVIQFIDNHFIIPFFVSSRVKINALISIVVVLLGGGLWGIPGMFLSIPITGVLKIVFDRIPELKPWGKLLGDEVPSTFKGEKNLLGMATDKVKATGTRKKAGRNLAVDGGSQK